MSSVSLGSFGANKVVFKLYEKILELEIHLSTSYPPL